MSRLRAAEVAALSFGGTWRQYQQMALAAFEQNLHHGSRRTYIVAPPGSGKTLLGMEMVRRLGNRAMVLVPNSALQGQWLRAAQDFAAPPGLAAASESAPIACLTYQSLCQLDDPSAAIGAVARQRWATERAQATGSTPAEVESEAETWAGAAAERRKRELARITAGLKREIARAEHGSVQVGDLLAGSVRERIKALRSGGVATVVLDECHHLASMWGYVIRAVLSELGDVHVIGLTATPPTSATMDENELIAALLGPVGFTIPVPALVRERFLAPYQELAWLTRPLDAETAWLAEHDLRFTELITAVHVGEDGVASLPEWVIARVRERRSDGHAAERRHGDVGWIPAAAPRAGKGRGQVLGHGGRRAAGRDTARRGLSRAAGPRRLARAARGLRPALPGCQPCA